MVCSICYESKTLIVYRISDVLSLLLESYTIAMNISDWIAVVGIIIGGIIAFLIDRLQRRLSFRDEMTHGADIRTRVDELLQRIRGGGSRKVEFINIKRYKKDYPHNNKENRHGYTYQGAELKGYSYDGVEFFNGIREVYFDNDDNVTLRKTDKPAGFNVFETGLVPYGWIEYINPIGDNTAWRPQFFTLFKGKIGKRGKYRVPYKNFRFYKRSDHYDERNDPPEMEFISVKVIG